jgi:hypothetical protein
MSFTPSRRPSRRRSLAAFGAAALVAPLLPLTAADAAPALPPTQDPREFACPPGQVEDAGFSDTSDNVFALEINCLAGYEITTGVAPGRYAPAEEVTRVQMAQFIARLATDVAGLRLDSSDAGFTDLDGLSTAAKNAINGLANAGIVNGTTATTYGPRGAVKRDQMATFIAKLQEKVAKAFPAGEDYFTDDEDSFHEANINRIAGAGIVTGTREGSYDPRGNVTRQQMAAFLMRYVEDQVEAGEIEGIYVRDNEVLATSPSQAASLPAQNDEDGADDPADNRDYTVSGLVEGVEYRITLVAAGNVRDEGGITRFTDTDDDNLAEVGRYTSDITTVNGESVARSDGGPSAPSTTTATPENGQITFTIDGDGEDSVVPVVYTNGGKSPRLELASDDRPIEAFGLGGVTTYTIPAAETSADGEDGVVISLSEKAATGTFVVDTEADGGGDLRYAYDGNDTYRVEGTLVPQEDFLAELSRGDTVEVGAYSADASGNSQFDIAEDTPTRPATAAEKGEDEQGGDDITVTVTPGTPSDVAAYDSFVIERAPVTGALNQDEMRTGTVGTFETIATPAASTDADPEAEGFQYVDRNVPEGSYRYRAAGVIDGDQSAFGVDPNNETSDPPPASDSTGPVADDAVVSADQAPTGTTSGGDSFRITFNEALATPPSGALIRVRAQVSDTETQTFDFRNQDNSLFSRSGSTLTVTLGPDVDPLRYPLTIVAQAGITDTNGNNWNLSGSSDLVIDVEPPAA